MNLQEKARRKLQDKLGMQHQAVGMDGNEILSRLNRLSKVKTIKDINQLTTVLFPGTYCPLMGAGMIASGIDDCLMVIVGTDECSYYAKNFNAVDRYSAVSDRCVSVVLDSQDVTFGSAESMHKAFKEIVAEYHPKCVMLVTTCIIEVIGDDYDAIAEELTKQYNIPVMAVHTEHFKCEDQIPGLERAITACSKIMDKKICDGSVNVLGLRMGNFSETELHKFLKEAGIKLGVQLPGGCKTDEIRHAAAAKVNIVVNDIALPLAQTMHMVFGCGCEMAGTTVSKAIAKWFKGKEMALAMGLEMAIARLGVFAVMWISPIIADRFGNADGIIGPGDTVVASMLFCGCLLCVGLINFIVFSVMDSKFDKQLVAAGLATDEKSPEDEFHISDLGKIFQSKMFWLVALLCVLYYSAIFPFQRYAPNMLEVTLGVDATEASRLFSCFPILAMLLTPLLGIFLDRKGKGASMLMVGAVIMIACHLSFAFLLPMFPSKALALTLIVVLGVSFSLVPAALWPSVPKIIDEKILGSAYCLIFWVQNIGLCLVPKLIGSLLLSTGGYMVPLLLL